MSLLIPTLYFCIIQENSFAFSTKDIAVAKDLYLYYDINRPLAYFSIISLKQFHRWFYLSLFWKYTFVFSVA